MHNPCTCSWFAGKARMNVINTLKACLVASSPLVLFLLVTATTVSQHTDAICDDEWEACFEDAVCNSCYYDWAVEYDFNAYNECIADYPAIDYGGEIDWCFVYGAGYCCKDEANVNGDDCLGNHAYVEHSICNLNYSVTSAEKGEGCTALACNDGRVAVGADVDDDSGVAGGDTGVDSGDADVVDDDSGTADDDTDDVAGDDAGVEIDDEDVDEVGDDAGIAGDSGGTSRVGSSSPSVALMAAGGFALLMVASFLAAWL